MSRCDLTDREWEVIQPLLPNRPRGMPRVTTAGSSTASLHFAHRGAVARSAGGSWALHDRLQPLVQEGGGMEARFQCLERRDAGEASSHRQFDLRRAPTRGGLTGKIHVIVGTNGLPVKFVLSAGQVSDKARVEELLDGVPPAHDTVADRGHDAQAILDLIRDHGSQPRIPTQSNRKKQRSVDPAPADSAISSSASSTAQTLPRERHTRQQTRPKLPVRHRPRIRKTLLAS